MLAAFRSFASFCPGTHFKAWFYRILINRHYFRFRKSRRQPAAVDVEDVPELYLFHRTAEAGMHRDSDDPALALMHKLTAEQVRGAVAALPNQYRVPVALFFLDELPYDAIAALLGCPIGTVRSRLHRGRRMLQKLLWHVATEQGLVPLPNRSEAPA